jgi:2-polyprenyl-3-methyl-5-hydroxy-6-metoxy-1,4-benzoquinol methylase
VAIPKLIEKEVKKSLKGYKYIKWTDKKVNDLWKYYLTNEIFREKYSGYAPHFYECIKNHLKNRKILEVGFGTGAFLEILHKNGFDFEGIDIDRKMVDNFKKRLPGSRVFVSRILDFNPPYKYDALCIFEVVEHLMPEDLNKSIKKANSLLNKGGLFIFTVPNNEYWPRHMIFCPNCKTLFHRYQHTMIFDEKTVRALMKENGFQTKEIIFGTYDDPKPIKPKKEAQAMIVVAVKT